MYKPKEDIYKALNALGYYTVQGAQSNFVDDPNTGEKQIPAITFRIEDQDLDVDLDNDIAEERVTAVVDIWTDNEKDENGAVTKSASQLGEEILSEVEAAMRAIGYRLASSMDVPSPPGFLAHKNCRFELII